MNNRIKSTAVTTPTSIRIKNVLFFCRED